MEARQWAEAERLTRAKVEMAKKRAASALAMLPSALNNAQRNAIRSLAVSLEQFGNIQREQGKAECSKTYEEAISLCQRIGDESEESVVAFNLGRAYTALPALRNIAQAEHWYRRGLELTDENDSLTRGRVLGQLGSVANERFNEAQAANKPQAELLRHLNDALQFYLQALDLLPLNALNDLAVTHNQLGIIYAELTDFANAIPHWREAIRYEEMQGNLYGAGRTRRNVAVALAQVGRLADAMDYARSALRGFSSSGDRAAGDLESTQELIKRIESLMREKR
jgi:tetratricopeptide (TPR) repeat protein